MEHVVLVDEFDNEIGSMEKMEAHKKGVLHRAFSLLVYNSKGEILLQKRALQKYHSAGLWSNTCCSHPRPGEDMLDAVHRKLMHEMGISLLPKFSHKFIYHTRLGDLTENEYDYVFTGKFDGDPVINREEVEDWKYMPPKDIRLDIKSNPDHYSYWFKLMMGQAELVHP